jgi:peptidoglycan/LPS O-acetylase OafA/YrhL
MVLGVGLFALGVYWLLGNYSSHSTKAYFGIAFILIGFIVGLVGAVQASNARARRR